MNHYILKESLFIRTTCRPSQYNLEEHQLGAKIKSFILYLVGKLGETQNKLETQQGSGPSDTVTQVVQVSVDQDSIPWLSQTKRLTNLVFTASLLDIQHLNG